MDHPGQLSPTGFQSFRCTQKKHYYDYSFIIMKKQPRNKGLVNIAWPTESVHKYACKFIYYVYYAYSYLYILLHTYTCIHIICIHILDTLRKQNHTRSMVTNCPKCIIKLNRGLFALIIFGLLCFGYQFVRKDGHGSRGNQLTERPPYNET